MRLADHHARVREAERNVEARRAETLAHCRRTVGLWRAGWTPGRIVIAGLAAGFLSGRANPLRMGGSSGLLNLLRTLAQLLESHGMGSTAVSANADTSPPADADDASTPEPAAIWPHPPRRKAPPFVTTP